MNKFQAYAAETRAGILSTTIIPVIAGAAVYYHSSGYFFLKAFTAVLFGFIFLHLGTNVINDYFDDRDGTDKVNKKYISPFTGGSRMLQSGMLSPREIMAEAIMLFILAAGFLCYAAFLSGAFILLMLAFAAASGISYSAPPLRISRTGFGELLVALNFGPVICFTSYYSQAHTFSQAPLAVSIPMGLMTASFVIICGFPDHEADKKTGKRTLVVRMGKGPARFLYAGVLAAAYASVAAAVAAGFVPAGGLFALAAVPVSAAATVLLWKNYNTPSKLAPACAMTLAAHLIAGAGLITAFFLGK